MGQIILNNILKIFGNVTDVNNVNLKITDSEFVVLANCMVVMRHGDIMQIGSPLEVYEQPINQFVAGFIGSPSMNFLEAWVEEKNSRLTVKGQEFEFGVLETLCERIGKAQNRDII